MAEAARRHDWQQTAGLMSVMVNIHRDRKKKAVRPEDFHPLGGDGRRGRRARTTTSDARILKAMFIDRKVPASLLNEIEAKAAKEAGR